MVDSESRPKLYSTVYNSMHSPQLSNGFNEARDTVLESCRCFQVLVQVDIYCAYRCS